MNYSVINAAHLAGWCASRPCRAASVGYLSGLMALTSDRVLEALKQVKYRTALPLEASTTE